MRTLFPIGFHSRSFRTRRSDPILSTPPEAKTEKHSTERRGENRGDRSRSWSLSTANGEDMFSPRKSIARAKVSVGVCAVVAMTCCIAWSFSTAFAGEKQKKKPAAKKETVATSQPAKAQKRPATKPASRTMPAARPTSRPAQPTNAATASRASAQVHPNRLGAALPTREPQARSTLQPVLQRGNPSALARPESRPPVRAVFERPSTRAPVEPEPPSAKRRPDSPAKPKAEARTPLPRPTIRVDQPPVPAPGKRGEPLPHPRRRVDPPPEPKPEVQEPLPRPRHRVDPPPEPKPEEQEPLPHPKQRLDDDTKPGGKERRKPPADDPPSGRRDQKPRFPYVQPPIAVPVVYEICVSCNHYPCHCEWYYEEYYVEEYAYYEPVIPRVTLEDVNFALTSAAILTNGIMISREQRSPAAAFFGYVFGASSLYVGLSGKAEHPVANVLLGAASIARLRRRDRGAAQGRIRLRLPPATARAAALTRAGDQTGSNAAGAETMSRTEMAPKAPRAPSRARPRSRAPSDTRTGNRIRHTSRS